MYESIWTFVQIGGEMVVELICVDNLDQSQNSLRYCVKLTLGVLPIRN